MVQVFPRDYLLEKYLYDGRANVNALLSPHYDPTTDPCDLFLPGTIIALKDAQHFYSDFPGVVASTENSRVSTATKRLRLSLVT